MSMVLGTVIILMGSLAGVDGMLHVFAGALFGFALGTGIRTGFGKKGNAG